MLTLSFTEGFVTWACVTVTFLLLGFTPIVALLMGSIGIATAPAATFAIMNRLDIGGTRRSMLGGMVILNDAIEIVGVPSSERALIKWRSWMTGGGELVGEEEIIRDKLQREPLTIRQVLPPDCLRVPFKVSSKGEAVCELIRAVHWAGFIDNPGQVLEIIMQRERQGGVTLGDGIAIPHSRLPELRQPVVAMGIMPEGEPIQMGGLGEQPIGIIYLVLSPAEPHELPLQALAAIAKMLRNKEAREGLRRAKNEKEAVEIINRYSKIT